MAIHSGSSLQPSWTTVSIVQGLPLPTHPPAPSRTPHPTTTNRFTRSKTSSPTHMDIDKLIQGSPWQDEDSDGNATHSGDDQTPPLLNLQDISRVHSDMAESTLTTPSALFSTQTPSKSLMVPIVNTS